MMMQALSPEEEVWSYQWDYTMGEPDTTLWEYPVGFGTASFAGDEGMRLFGSVFSGQHAGLRLKDYTAWFGQKAVYEVEVKVVSARNNGFRIVCASGSNGVSDNHGLHVTLNGNYLNVLTGSMELGTVTKTAPLTYGEWHKVRLELDTHAGSNKVYLDDTLVATIANADISTQYTTSVWCLVQGGDAYVKSVRYRKED